MGQTYMSVTDPGNGHIYGTICKKRWTTNGVIVHLVLKKKGIINKIKKYLNI